jgi:hypothetical protein
MINEALAELVTSYSLKTPLHESIFDLYMQGDMF